jgi:hypothetical protein
MLQLNGSLCEELQHFIIEFLCDQHTLSLAKVKKCVYNGEFVEKHLIIVRDVPMTYGNFILILIAFSEIRNFCTFLCSCSPNLYCLLYIMSGSVFTKSNSTTAVPQQVLVVHTS